jgi:hypothetical protein
MLALIAWYVANVHAPKLNRVKILEYALVRELPEAVTNYTFNGDREWRVMRREMQKDALARLHSMLESDHPNVSRALREYEKKDSPEALLVYWLNAIVPALTLMRPAGRQHLFKKISGSVIDDFDVWGKHLKSHLLKAGKPPAIAETLLNIDHMWVLEMIKRYRKMPG